MDEKETAQDVQQPKKRRSGRKPMTREQKDAAAKAREELKRKAENMTPEVMIQYQDIELNAATLVEAAKADFQTVRERTQITGLKLYVKPEERAAYYVVNESFNGKITF